MTGTFETEEQPPQPSTSRLNLWAILLGSFVDIAATTVLQTLISAMFDGPLAVPLFLLSGLSMTTLGGYVAAAVARRRSIAHGLGVGVLSALVGLALAQLEGTAAAFELPEWFNPVGLALTVPTAVLGAWLRRRLEGETQIPTVARPGVYPNLKQAIGLMGLLTLVTLIGFAAVGFVTWWTMPRPGAVPEWIPPAFVAGIMLCYALILAWAVRKSHAPLAQLFPLKRIRVGTFVAVLATLVGLSILFAQLIHLIRRAGVSPEVPVDPSGAFGESGIWSMIVFLAVLAPVAEELLFRGIILRGFLSRYTAGRAILASSVLFGLAHLIPLLMFSAMILGSFFAWWRVRTGSLVPSLVGHVLNNTLALALARLPIPTEAATSATGSLAHPIWIDLTAVALILVGIWQFRQSPMESTEAKNV